MDPACHEQRRPVLLFGGWGGWFLRATSSAAPCYFVEVGWMVPARHAQRRPVCEVGWMVLSERTHRVSAPRERTA